MKNLLIVMEEDRFRDALVAAAQGGYRVFLCSDTRTASKVLGPGLDALLLDLYLEEADVKGFLAQVRDRLPERVIGLTVHRSQEVLLELKELGVTAVVMQPCTLEEILRWLYP